MTTLDWITSCAAVVTAAATALLAWFAFTAFRASVAQLRLLSADSARQTRPYVNVDVAPGLHGNGFWDLRIENLGRSIACDVQIDAGPLAARDAEDHISEPLAAFLTRPMTLPPGAKRRVMWRMEAEPHDNRTVAGANEDVPVKVTYTDVQGERYTDTFNVTTEGYGRVAPSPLTGSRVGGSGRTKGEESLANIERALQTLNMHVGMLRD